MWKCWSRRASVRSKTSYDIITEFRRKDPRTKIPETAIPEPHLLTETENTIIDDIVELLNKQRLTSLQSFYLLEWLGGIMRGSKGLRGRNAPRHEKKTMWLELTCS